MDRAQEQGVAACVPWLIEHMERVTMLFVRCRNGISHNPAEAISAADAAMGARVLLRFIEEFRPKGMV